MVSASLIKNYTAISFRDLLASAPQAGIIRNIKTLKSMNPNQSKIPRQSPKPATKLPEKAAAPKEIGGRKGPEPTRFGDWEKNCRCIDF